MRCALALAIVLLAGPAAAQHQCTEDDLVKPLLDQFEERLMFQGVTKRGNLIELYASEDRGTWSIVKQINGLSCIVSFGEQWISGVSNEPDDEGS